MKYPLGIYVYGFGARTETFIRRHVCDLLPAQTVAIGRILQEPDERDWEVQGPLLDLEIVKDRESAKTFLADHNVQVVMGEYLDDSLPWLGICQEMGIRFFGHAHGYDVSERLLEPKWRQEYGRYADAAGLITMNQSSRLRLLDLGLPASKVHVIPYGVDVPNQPLVRRDRSTVCIAAVGRMVPKKGPLLTLEAFLRVSQKCDGLFLQYVGEGRLLQDAKDFVMRNGLQGRVHLPGSLSNPLVLQVLEGADIFVQHSIRDSETGDQEGLPVAILEAMAKSLPVVSTRHSGIPEAVVEGITGCLVDEGDVDAMAAHIELLAREPDRRRAMGLAGWTRARDCFSWELERNRLLKTLGFSF